MEFMPPQYRSRGAENPFRFRGEGHVAKPHWLSGVDAFVGQRAAHGAAFQRLPQILEPAAFGDGGHAGAHRPANAFFGSGILLKLLRV